MDGWRVSSGSGRRQLTVMDALQNRHVPHNLNCDLNPALVGEDYECDQ
jgi:hypothetical protein